MANSAKRRMRPNQRTRILLVDDHPMVRERLTEIINREPDLMICGEAEDRHQALDLIPVARPDLAIIDLTLKNSHGLDLIKDIHARHPEMLMLVLSMHDESLQAERVVQAGARGYITKQEATRNILLAIRKVLAAELYLSEKITSRVIARLANRTPGVAEPAIDSLSDRELQVFELTGHGRSTSQIAQELHVEVKTVETYRARIKDKLRLKDGADLLQFAIRWHRNR